MATPTIDSLDLRGNPTYTSDGSGGLVPERPAVSTAELMQRAMRAVDNDLMRRYRDMVGHRSWVDYEDVFGGMMTQTKKPDLSKAPDMPAKPISLSLPVEFAPIDDLSEYDKVAADLGFAPEGLKKNRAELRRRELIGFMLDNGMPVYQTEHVKKYMDGLIAVKNHEAAVEKQKKGGTGRLGVDVPVLGWKWAELSKYKHAIPIDILKRAQAIKAEYPTAEFSVSDYEVVNPDPFISVTIDGCDRVVFGVWDEPGFKAIGRDVKP